MCGIIGVIGSPEASKEAFLGLITLQHRGQDAAGILSYDQSFHLVKNTGLVESVFSKEDIESLTGQAAIGHARYSTVGRGNVLDVQPLLLNYPFGIGMVHNGNIVNYLEVKEKLRRDMRRVCLTTSDTETVLNWLAHHLEDANFDSLLKAVQSVFQNIHGSYSVVGMMGGHGLFAFRDPLGIRPLVLGKKIVDGKPVYMFASETIALSFLGYEFEKNLAPGEVIFIDSSLNVYSKVLQSTSQARPCMFEWVYFASAESSIESTPVYGVRLELGRSLAKKIRKKIQSGEIEADLVAPVPDTSRTAGIALAEVLGLPYREVLIKNRYITRTFILGSQSKREKAVDLKLNTVASEIRGKNIILVDDSIVRGTTSKKIVQLVKKAGAKKVYFVSTCPPIQYPCFYGIDFPDQNELIASRVLKEGMASDLETLEKTIAGELGADGVVFQDLNGLIDSISIESDGRVKKPCTACLDGKYPSDVSGASRFAAQRKEERSKT